MTPELRNRQELLLAELCHDATLLRDFLDGLRSIVEGAGEFVDLEERGEGKSFQRIVETNSSTATSSKESDPNRRERNRFTFWLAILNGHFDTDGKCSRVTPYKNVELIELGMTGNPSEMFPLHLADLVNKESAKPRELYKTFCNEILESDPDRTYKWIRQQLGDKQSGYREKGAAKHTLDGTDAKWRERELLRDGEIDGSADI
ncbi:MAG: hypothetical protein VXZ82_06615 [Planctomycetota bacterium]|nr:hypothetical protein [Planctomycetota bacterium]